MHVPAWLEPWLHVALWIARPKYLVGVFPICIKDGAVLLIDKRLGASTGCQLPGGGKPYHMPPKVAACGELFEETGLRAEPKRLLRVRTQFIEQDRDINIAYLVTEWTGDVQPQDSLEISGARWVPFKEALLIVRWTHVPLLRAAIRASYKYRNRFGV